jgi:hypothetical protein
LYSEAPPRPAWIRPPRSTSRQGVIIDSNMTRLDIFDAPTRRSTKMIGISVTRHPSESA